MALGSVRVAFIDCSRTLPVLLVVFYYFRCPSRDTHFETSYTAMAEYFVASNHILRFGTLVSMFSHAQVCHHVLGLREVVPYDTLGRSGYTGTICGVVTPFQILF